MEKRNLIIYRVTTGLLTLLMLLSVGMYVFQYQMVSENYALLGFPTFIIYPLAIAKILGLVAIWTNKSKTLKEWAYAGFVFNTLLGVGAHLNVGDGEFAGAAVGLILAITSYVFNKKVFGE